jgi:hypothetical protein
MERHLRHRVYLVVFALVVAGTGLGALLLDAGFAAVIFGFRIGTDSAGIFSGMALIEAGVFFTWAALYLAGELRDELRGR